MIDIRVDEGMVTFMEIEGSTKTEIYKELGEICTRVLESLIPYGYTENLEQLQFAFANEYGPTFNMDVDEAEDYWEEYYERLEQEEYENYTCGEHYEDDEDYEGDVWYDEPISYKETTSSLSLDFDW